MNNLFHGLGTAVAPYQISDSDQLNNVRHSLEAHYVLINDIDLSEHENFNPIGSVKNPFLGVFDGNGYTIRNFKFSDDYSYNVGFFAVNEGEIKNVGLENVNVHGVNTVAGLVAENDGKISDSYVTGSVEGKDYVGALVARNFGNIWNSHAIGTVKGNEIVGGLIARNYSIVCKSHSDVDVKGEFDVGGFVAINNTKISNSYATGIVEGIDVVGGLVGWNSGIILNSYAEGNVSGFSCIDKFIVRDYGEISNSYGSGTVNIKMRHNNMKKLR